MTCDLPCSANLLASTRYRISELIMLGRTMSGLYCPTILTEPIVCIRYNLTLCYLARAGGPEGALASLVKAGSIGTGGADPLSSITATGIFYYKTGYGCGIIFPSCSTESKSTETSDIYIS